jgi:prepilin-type N-terminal cleavage/methylation domain-containing protein
VRSENFSPAQAARKGRAFTLVELVISVFVLAIMLVSLYAGFSSGFAFVRLSQDNLRATQILNEKLETIRTFNWMQVTNPAVFQRSFTNSYSSPSQTNNLGTLFYGTVAIADPPAAIPADYRDNMLQVIVSVYWTNQVHNDPSKAIARSRQIQTFISRFGLQDYFYQ